MDNDVERPFLTKYCVCACTERFQNSQWIKGWKAVVSSSCSSTCCFACRYRWKWLRCGKNGI